MNEYRKTGCNRCGQCCSNHTPSLHLQDIQLIKRRLLSFSDLYTLRKGERVYDNFNRATIQLNTELIKIKEKPDSGFCVFYDETGSACSIYHARPLQCRAFECWRPEPFIKEFKKQKLTRRDLISDKNLLEIMEHHEKKVSPERFHKLLTSTIQPSDNMEKIIEMINYDLYFRGFISEKLNLPADELDLYFGRPLIHCARPYGYILKRTNKGEYVLEHVQT